MVLYKMHSVLFPTGEQSFRNTVVHQGKTGYKSLFNFLGKVGRFISNGKCNFFLCTFPSFSTNIKRVTCKARGGGGWGGLIFDFPLAADNRFAISMVITCVQFWLTNIESTHVHHTLFVNKIRLFFLTHKWSFIIQHWAMGKGRWWIFFINMKGDMHFFIIVTDGKDIYMGKTKPIMHT